MVEQTIQKIHIAKLASGESDPGAASGVTQVGPAKSFSDGNGGQWIVRAYEDATELPSPAAWAPSDEASLEMWFDPTNAAKITESAGKVSAWEDETANYTFVQATSGEQPTTASRSINSKNVLDFATDENLDMGSLTWPGTTFLIGGLCVMDDPVPQNDSSFIRSGNNNYFSMRSYSTALCGPMIDCTGGGNGDVSSSGTNIKDTPTIWLAEFDLANTTLSLWINGTEVATDAAGYIAGITSNELNLFGRTISVAPGNGAAGDVAMFLSVADAVRQKFEGYLAHKWGIAASLPGGHPYKSEAP